MKNTNIFIVFAFVFCCSWSTLAAQQRAAAVSSYIGAQAQVGEWSLLPSESKFGPSVGASGGVGFVYELQVGRTYRPTRFLLDVGLSLVGGQTAFTQNGLAVDTLLRNQEDILYNQQGWKFDYVYERAYRRDAYNNIALQIPVMVGLQHKKFYMLAGVKLGANMWTKTNLSAVYNTYGQYAMLEGDGIVRDNKRFQFFEGYQLDTVTMTNFNMNVDLSFEIGCRLGVIASETGYDVPKRKTECRLALFADYGLTDIHKAGKNKALEIPSKYDTDPFSDNYVYDKQNMVNSLVLNDIMSTSNFANAVKNLVVGVKLTILFRAPEKGKCVLCNDAYRSSVLHYPGGGGVQYEE